MTPDAVYGYHHHAVYHHVPVATCVALTATLTSPQDDSLMSCKRFWEAEGLILPALKHPDQVITGDSDNQPTSLLCLGQDIVRYLHRPTHPVALGDLCNSSLFHLHSE